MIWTKLIGTGLLLSAIAGAGWWLVNTVKENERLKLNKITLEQARVSDAEVMKFLRLDIAAKEMAVQRRTEKIVEINQRLLRAQNEVRIITKTVVTEVERECLLQPVPAAVIDFMFSDGEINSE